MTKRKLLEALSDLNDDARIEFMVSTSDVLDAKKNGLCLPLECGGETYVFGLPGDMGFDKDTIAFSLWAETE